MIIGNKKNRFKPFYKKLLAFRENIQDRKKILQFKKNKWHEFVEFYKRKQKWYKKFRPQNQKRYLVSEYPNKFNSYKNRYKITHLAFKTFSFLYGILNKKSIKNNIAALKKKKLKTKNLIFLKNFEKRLDVVLYRAKFANTIRSAQQLIVHNKILVNNKFIKTKSYVLETGDLISLNLKNLNLIKLNISKTNFWPLPPKNLTINYKTMQIVFGSTETLNLATTFSVYLNLEKILVSFYRH